MIIFDNELGIVGEFSEIFFYFFQQSENTKTDFSKIYNTKI